MGGMRKDSESEVPAGGVTTEKNVGWLAGGEDITQGIDRLSELSWIHGVRGQGVGKEEKGDVVTRFIERVENLCEEGEMFRCAGKCEAASYTTNTELDIYSVKVRERGREQGRTVIINHHLFGILLTDPVAKGAVIQRDCNRLDLLPDRPVLIALVRGWGQISMTMSTISFRQGQ